MIPVFARKLPAFTAARCGRGGARRVQAGSGQVGRSWGGLGWDSRDTWSRPRRCN